jgi:hypothetical protein
MMSPISQPKWLISARQRILYGTARFGLRSQVMDDPDTIRRKAARFFAKAASSKTAGGTERLTEVGRQLEVWADELEEMAHASAQKASEISRNEAKEKRIAVR